MSYSQTGTHLRCPYPFLNCLQNALAASSQIEKDEAAITAADQDPRPSTYAGSWHKLYADTR